MDTSRSVTHLQGLYTVVVGLALTVAIMNLIDQTAPVPIRLGALPYFVAYLVTLVPFYHGALRHLDSTYIDASTNTGLPRSGALMIDWSLLFVESCGLLALALLVNRPEAFSYTLTGLLAFDALWAFAAHLAFSPQGQKRSESTWAKINFATVILLILTLVALHAVDPAKPVETYRWIVVTTIAVGRTVMDYYLCWFHYYPQDTE